MKEASQGPCMVVESLGGMRFSARIRGHEVVTDQPIEGEGEDTGMMPSELFIASLGTCIGVYIANFCKRHDIPYRNMRIELSWSKAENPYRIAGIEVKIKAPDELPPQLRKPILRVARQCFIHETIKETPKITIDLSQ